MISIRDAQPTDETAWRDLWHGYNLFYETALPDAITAATWRRILDPRSPIGCRIVLRAEEVVGFAIHVLHEGTWTAKPICYLEDLFVLPQQRGAGVGRALLQDLSDLCGQRDWSRLYWHTRADNPARKLYDDFVAADDFVRYRVVFDETGPVAMPGKPPAG